MNSELIGPGERSPSPNLAAPPAADERAHVDALLYGVAMKRFAVNPDNPNSVRGFIESEPSKHSRNYATCGAFIALSAFAITAGILIIMYASAGFSTIAFTLALLSACMAYVENQPTRQVQTLSDLRQYNAHLPVDIDRDKPMWSMRHLKGMIELAKASKKVNEFSKRWWETNAESELRREDLQQNLMSLQNQLLGQYRDHQDVWNALDERGMNMQADLPSLLAYQDEQEADLQIRESRRSEREYELNYFRKRDDGERPYDLDLLSFHLRQEFLDRFAQIEGAGGPEMVVGDREVRPQLVQAGEPDPAEEEEGVVEIEGPGE